MSRGQAQKNVKEILCRYNLDKVSNRFWSKVDIRGPDECWNWLAGKTETGYGTFSVGEEMLRAPRVSWVLCNLEEIPDGLVVLHSCSNPSCVNPAHLSVGTMADNARDRDKDGHTAKGSTHGNVRLSEEDVLAMVELRAEGETYSQLSERFGVSMPAVEDILMGRSWAWLTGRKR